MAPKLTPDPLPAILDKLSVTFDASALEKAFPTVADREQFNAFHAEFDKAIAANDKAAARWDAISKDKEVAVRLISMALGRPL